MNAITFYRLSEALQREQGNFRAQETTASYTNYYSFNISNCLPSAKREINFLYLKAICFFSVLYLVRENYVHFANYIRTAWMSISRFDP